MTGTGSTIAAIATAIVPQQGSVGIVRLSGPDSWAIARRLFIAPGRQPWDSHRILYGYICDPGNGDTIDEALLLLMAAPRSFTREDVVEFHCHGGIVPVQQVLSLCLDQGARLAKAGEFSLRAFLNGRIDLTQAESIQDLVAAQSTEAARSALAGLQGKLAAPIRRLRQDCIEVLAEIEARIDFEDDLPPLDEPTLLANLGRIAAELDRLRSTADRGELLRSGLKVAIIGRPNVGKSSLLNAWSQSDRAIVTDLPGTTRDVVESQLVVGGIPIQVLDTAGIRETADQVERIGVERSRRAAQRADILLFVIDAVVGWTDGDREIFERLRESLGDSDRPEASPKPILLVANKIDLLHDRAATPGDFKAPPHFQGFVTTAAAAPDPRDRGIDRLETALIELIHRDRLEAADLDLAINQRQAEAIQRAHRAIARVQSTVGQHLPLDFWTIDLRDAISALGEITGDDLTESILDRIFSQFCIGK
ncbi:MAG: tRNA uridine-5-carboxymethylaminomethyl(34) synthesis GTPase MnmE [Cyanophyceae cyanobacterium]